MAIALEDKPNVVAPGGDYPYGRIKDDTGVGDGTPVNTLVYGDFHQFFAKLLADAGITANGDPENASDGFQYNEALAIFIVQNTSGEWVIVDSGGGAPPLEPGWEIETYGGLIHPLQFRREGNNVRIIGGVLNNGGSSPVFVLPAGYRPAHVVRSLIVEDTITALADISADGEVSVQAPVGTGIYVFNTTFPLG